MTNPSTTAHADTFAPSRLNGLALRNRIFKAATFEGMTPGGEPSQRLIDFHRDIAEGGVALTTVAYCAVEPDGRIADHMMAMHEGIRPGLERLAGAVHGAGAALSGQLAHCGHLSKNRSLVRSHPLAPSTTVNRIGLAQGMIFARAMSEADIDQMVDDYRRAAAFMKSVGFDALEIHFGHGYALCQFISPKTNRRTDAYGGSLVNRMRLPMRVLAAVRETVGDDFPLLGKISTSEGVRGGIELEESVEIARLLDRGGLDAIVTSGGSSSHNPMWLFRGDSLLPHMLAVEPSRLLRTGLRLAGKRFFREYPYHELYFLDEARRIRDAVDCKLVYIGGVSTRASLEQALAEFDFVQLGRVLVRDPAFVRHVQADPGYASGCTHCNRCAALIDHPDGIRCPIDDAPTT